MNIASVVRQLNINPSCIRSMSTILLISLLNTYSRKLSLPGLVSLILCGCSNPLHHPSPKIHSSSHSTANHLASCLPSRTHESHQLSSVHQHRLMIFWHFCDYTLIFFLAQGLPGLKGDKGDKGDSVSILYSVYDITLS